YIRFILFFAFFIYSTIVCFFFFFFSSRRRHTRCLSDWSSDVCSSDLQGLGIGEGELHGGGARVLGRGLERLPGAGGEPGEGGALVALGGDLGVGALRRLLEVGGVLRELVGLGAGGLDLLPERFGPGALVRRLLLERRQPL